MTTSWTLTVDTEHPPRLAAFWRLALGYQDAAPPQGWETWEQWLTHFEVPPEEWDDGASLEDPEGRLPRLTFLKVPEGKVAKNRLHLDLQVSGGRNQPQEARLARITATVERLVAAGGAVLREDRFQEALDHVVMADPEGNEFCVV